MLKRILFAVVLALVLIGALLYSRWRVAPATVSGFIEADEVRVGSRVGGRVSAVKVAEGQAVKRGEALLVLEAYDLREQRAQAEAQLAGRRAELARLEAGFRKEEIAQAKALHDEAAATVEELVRGPRAEDIAVAKALAEAAVAQRDLAKLTYERTKAVFDRNAATPEEMDQATHRLRVAESTLSAQQQELAKLQAGTRAEEIARARARLAQAEAQHELTKSGYRQEEVAQAKAAVAASEAALAALDRRIAELTVTAPVDGYVEASDLQPGDLVAPNAPVMSLTDTQKMWVRAYVPENRLGLRLNQELEVSVDAFPGRRFRGHLSFIARQGEFTPSNIQTPEERSKQVFRIKVTMDEGGDVLRPGMAADVWLP